MTEHNVWPPLLQARPGTRALENASLKCLSDLVDFCQEAE